MSICYTECARISSTRKTVQIRSPLVHLNRSMCHVDVSSMTRPITSCMTSNWHFSFVEIRYFIIPFHFWPPKSLINGTALLHIYNVYIFADTLACPPAPPSLLFSSQNADDLHFIKKSYHRLHFERVRNSFSLLPPPPPNCTFTVAENRRKLNSPACDKQKKKKSWRRKCLPEKHAPRRKCQKNSPSPCFPAS